MEEITYSLNEVSEAVHVAAKAVRASCYEIINQRDDIIRELIRKKTCIKCKQLHQTEPEHHD